jgi:hypothetical protein
MKHALLLTTLALGGCMTIEQLPTAGTAQVFDAACMSKTTPFEVQQAALQELTRRGLTCREVAMQMLQIRMGNPPAPVYVPAPYVMPTQQPNYTPAPQGIYATLMGQQPTTSASGQAAYICQYRTGIGMSSVVRLASEGPCPPTTTLR